MSHRKMHPITLRGLGSLLLVTMFATSFMGATAEDAVSAPEVEDRVLPPATPQAQDNWVRLQELLQHIEHADHLLALPSHNLKGKKGGESQSALLEMEGGVCFAAFRKSEELCNAAYAKVHNKWCYKGFQENKPCQRKNDRAAYKRSQCVQAADKTHGNCRLIRKRKRHNCYRTKNSAHKKCFHTLDRSLRACRQTHEAARAAVARKERGRDRGTGQPKSDLALEHTGRVTARKCRKKAYRMVSECSHRVREVADACMRKWQVETPSPPFQVTPTSPWTPVQADAVVPEE